MRAKVGSKELPIWQLDASTPPVLAVEARLAFTRPQEGLDRACSPLLHDSLTGVIRSVSLGKESPT
jgi:hypothetical protein